MQQKRQLAIATEKRIDIQGVQEKLCFCPRIFKIMQPLHHEHYWAAIGCTQNGQPIGATAYTQI